MFWDDWNHYSVKYGQITETLTKCLIIIIIFNIYLNKIRITPSKFYENVKSHWTLMWKDILKPVIDLSLFVENQMSLLSAFPFSLALIYGTSGASSVRPSVDVGLNDLRSKKTPFYTSLLLIRLLLCSLSITHKHAQQIQKKKVEGCVYVIWMVQWYKNNKFMQKNK